MKKVGYLSVFFCFVFSAHADFTKIAKEWDQQNINVMANKAEIDLKTYDYERVGFQRTWNLSYEYDFSDNNLETSPLAFIPISSSTESHTLSLSKGFDWGGTFAFNNFLSSTDYGTTTSLAIPKYYHFNQGFTYTQSLGADFLGRVYKKEKEVAAENVHLAKLEYDEKREEGLFTLLQRYTRASLNKSLIKFQGEAKARADKRLNLIRRWVRDGLRERVDLFQAQAAALAAEENVKLAEIELDQALQQLGTSLHRDVTGGEVNSLVDDEVMTKNMTFEVEENKNLKVLQSRMRIFKERLKQADFSVMPTIELELGWRSNDFDAARGTAISNGSFVDDNDEKSVGISVTWPIGSLAQKAQKEQAAINLNLAQKRFETFNRDLAEIRESLKSQLTTLERNIASIKNRIDLNKKSLKEYNRLYNRGRADLDQVIRAEETLINSEISLIRQQAEFEQRYGELSYLNGTLINSTLGQ